MHNIPQKDKKGRLSIQIKYQNKSPKQSKMKQTSPEIILSSFCVDQLLQSVV